jgi:hypothetical protein
MTKHEAAKLVAVLSAAYPRQEIEEATLAIYCEMLLDLDHAIAERGVKVLMANSRWFPTIAEIREAVLEQQSPLPSPAEAWELLDISWQVANARGLPDSFGDDVPRIVLRALKVVGGKQGYRFSDNVNALRSQFLRVSDELRHSALAGGAETRRAALEQGDLDPEVKAIMPGLREVK